MCNAIIVEERNKDSKTKKCWVLISKQGPKRRPAGLAYERETKSLDMYLDEVARDVEAEPLPLSPEQARRRFSLATFLSALLSACTLSSHHLPESEANSSDRYSLTVAHPNSLLSASFIALTRLDTSSVPNCKAALAFS